MSKEKKNNPKKESDKLPALQNKERPPKEAVDMRLNRYVAHCGICSRRKADEFIKEKLVTVDGKIVTEPGFRVKEKAKVTFKGEIIKPVVKKVYILMNKPKDCITTAKDELGRKTVMDIIKNKVKERVFPVGRLDRATKGLLLLTNDGDLAKKLSHPSYKVKKVYYVLLDKPVTKRDLDKIRKGLLLEDGLAMVDGVSYVVNKPKNEVGITIHMGKNRIVRRIFEHLSYNVKQLDRVYYGGLTKKDLPRGFIRHLTDQEVIMLKHFV